MKVLRAYFQKGYRTPTLISLAKDGGVSFLVNITIETISLTFMDNLGTNYGRKSD